jgi:hypothetical protein
VETAAVANEINGGLSKHSAMDTSVNGAPASISVVHPSLVDVGSVLVEI